MAAGERWIDLLDPTLEELTANVPSQVHPSALEQLLLPAQHADEPRPKLESHGQYIFGVLLVAVATTENEGVYYQEIDLVMTREALVTVRKTPPEGHPPYDTGPARTACRPEEAVGMIVYRLVDDIAEGYLDLIDTLNDEIDDLEDGVEVLPSATIRERLSTLRHDLLHIRRTLAPRAMRFGESWTTASNSKGGRCSHTTSKSASAPPTTSSCAPWRASSFPAISWPASVTTTRQRSRTTRTT